jgi:proline racemase
MPTAFYRTVEMHAAGEPVRIVAGGYPDLPGATLLDKRRHAREHLDHIRKRLMLEPRGHAEMYGVIPTAPSHPAAQLAVLFTHHSGYSTMCGHATIAIGRWAVEHGIVAARPGPIAEFVLECPCGPVRVRAHRDGAGEGGGERIGRVEFDSVAAYASHLDQPVELPGFGRLVCDIAFGGAYYAILPASRLGLCLFETPLAELVAAATRLTEAGRAQIAIRHPAEPDLGFLYGTILTDDVPASAPVTHNLCIFGAGQVDRSPTGSGVTARLALDHRRGHLEIGASRAFRGLSGDPFSGIVLAETRLADTPAIIARIGGRAFYCGTAEFTVEPDDPLPDGLGLPLRLREIWG